MTNLQQLRKGSTPLLILSILSTDKMYGYQIMRELERRSAGYFTMTAALLYPALHHLEKDGLLKSEWQAGPGRRRRKYYSITQKGRNALAASRTEWRTFIATLQKTLKPANGD
ncbi:MAG TPA: PadR family transcriptional regulator [Anaerolineales bacterium]|nr:PadR family transcriptional regulator [Anaerolineales bacterium]